jgi:hypothetical protein
MKANTVSRFLSVLLALTFILTGCNKEEEGTPPDETLSLDTEEILSRLPSGLTNASDSYAQQCVGAIESALDMSTFIDNMKPPENAQRSLLKASGETWTWTFFNGTRTYTFYWTYKEENAKRYWTMDIGFEGEKYTYIYAWESNDGSQGQIQYNFNWVYAYDDTYSDEYEDLYYTYNWELDANNAYHFGYKYDSNDTDVTYYLQYDLVVNENGSGSMDYYLEDTLFWHMEWDVDGNGSWEFYSDGTPYLSGTWTAM